MKHESCNNPDLIGKKFERLTVLGFERHPTRKRWKWKCLCDCGNEVVVSPFNVRNGRTKSCGCYAKEVTRSVMTTHGETETRLYGIWSKMRNRCTSKTDAAYHNYGGRGIGICKEWGNFQAFYNWAHSHDYNDTLSIERKNVDGDYCPDNCCWIPKPDQNKNKRNTIRVELDGTEYPLKHACAILNIPYKAVHLRITRRGWSVERAISTPFIDGANCFTFGNVDFGVTNCKHCGKEFRKGSHTHAYCSAECKASYKHSA